ncbi:MAG: endospore germination permease [Firmicutes bacterium]|mgnify:FL=1|nr:endospore germination permease [Bacillota bacterium]
MQEVVAPRSGMATLVLMLMGSSIVYGVGKQAGADTWLAVIAAMILSVPFILVYARLVDLDPNNDIFQTLEKALGKLVAWTAAALYGWYALLLMYNSVNNLGNFIAVAGLVETPRAVPRLFLLVITLAAAKLGVEPLTRWSTLFLIVVVGISVFAFALVSEEIDYSNLQPILYDGIGPVAAGTFSTMAFPFLEAVLFIFIGAAYRGQGGARQVMLWGHLIAGATILFIITNTLAVIGPDVYRIQYYPVYGAASRIDVGGIFTRLEITVTFIFLATTFVKITVCLIAAARCCGYLVGEPRYTYLLTPLALSGIVGTFWLAEGTLEMEAMALQVWRPMQLVLQIILPVIIWIVAEIRLKSPKQQKAPQS